MSIKTRALLMSVIELLLEKQVITEDEIHEIKDVESLVEKLLQNKLITQAELEKMVVNYREFLSGLVKVIRGGKDEAKRFDKLRMKYGAKYPAVIQFVEGLQVYA